MERSGGLDAFVRPAVDVCLESLKTNPSVQGSFRGHIDFWKAIDCMGGHCFLRLVFGNLPFSLSPYTLLSFRYFLYLAVKNYIT